MAAGITNTQQCKPYTDYRITEAHALNDWRRTGVGNCVRGDRHEKKHANGHARVRWRNCLVCSRRALYELYLTFSEGAKLIQRDIVYAPSLYLES